jgi:GTPase SAR1 family protein
VRRSARQDVGGRDHLRLLWRHSFTGTQGVIFVVDCSDRARIATAAAELQAVAIDDQLFVRVRLDASRWFSMEQ